MSDRILGCLAIAGAAAMAAAAWGYAAPVEYEPVGPRAFPLLLALVMASCGAWLALRPAQHADWPQGNRLGRITICAGAIVVYALLFQLLGFILATVLMALPAGRVFGGTWRQCIAGGIGLGIVLYLMFDKVLDVVLPLGILHWN
ncbi:MAG TPA: tripartite tricarboxylate transporter TctB family protein [Noviherbaspirillum sp.]|nr:tripartite tricarboxylate transporter TctB family protein [Noviherbaspirillum sp.]